MRFTALQPYGVPGQIRVFTPKIGIQTDKLHIFSSVVVEPVHITDSYDNLLINGDLEAQGTGFLGRVMAGGVTAVAPVGNDFSSDDNCVALWKHDNGALTTDSKGTNTLTNFGVVADTGVKKEGDASGLYDSDRQTIADADLDSGFPFKNGESNTNMSIALWYRPTDVGSFATIIAKYSSSPVVQRNWVFQQNNTGTVRFVIYYNSGTQFEILTDSGTTLVNNQWYHIGFTINNGTGDWRIRIWDDTGSSVAETTGTATNGMTATVANFTIGGLDVSAQSAGYHDEVVIFNDILSAGEIDDIRADTFGNIATSVHIFSTDPVAALHITDSGNNVLMAGDLEVQGTGYLGTGIVSGDLTVDTDTLHVDSTQNKVGIGTVSPSARFHVQTGTPTLPAIEPTTTFLLSGNTLAQMSLVASTVCQMQFGDDTDENAGVIKYSHSDDAMTFRTNGSGEDMRIDVDGNVGINTVSPDTKLHVVGDVTFEGSLDMRANFITDLSGLHFNSAAELTISSGAVTLTQGHHSIDTEGNVANDDLDTMNGGNPGEVIFILPANDDRTVRIRHGVGNIYLKHQTAEQSYGFNSPQGSSGTFYVAGFYDFPTTDSNLDEGGTTQTHGDTNGSHAAHASLIAGGAGTATGGSGAITIVVSGTSIDDEANRVTSDSEVIVADITAMSTDEYFETTKKWLGVITYTLTVGGTGHTAFAADFNYGFSKYEDLGNTNFSISLLECVGRAGGNDTGFNIRLFHHNTADWTYAATGFVPGPTAGDASELANMNTDHGTEKNLTNGDPFAYKRTDLNQDIGGDNGEGIIIEITTSANRAVESMDLHIGVHSAPKFGYMATTKQHLIFMKHGPNWLEL